MMDLTFCMLNSHDAMARNFSGMLMPSVFIVNTVLYLLMLRFSDTWQAMLCKSSVASACCFHDYITRTEKRRSGISVVNSCSV